MYTQYARTFGANPYFLDSMIATSYTKVTNDVGMATITIPANQPVLSALALDDEVEIWRYDPHPAVTTGAYVDFRGLYRGHTLRTLDSGLEVADLFFFHENEILRRAINAYKAGNLGVTMWTTQTATTAMGALILDNFSGATVSTVGSIAREIAATDKTIAIGASVVPGSAVSNYTSAYKNVLTALQELAAVDNSVFQLTKASSTSSTWLFYLYAETFATDRRATVIFEPERENMHQPALDKRTIGEMTVAVVGGQGNDTTRTVRVRTSASRDSDTNNYEGFVDGRHLDTTAALDAYGDSAINEKAARPLLTFRPVQLPSFSYGQQYFWGDIVTVRYGGQDYVQRIAQVSVQYTAAGEQIELGFEDLP